MWGDSSLSVLIIASTLGGKLLASAAKGWLLLLLRCCFSSPIPFFFSFDPLSRKSHAEQRGEIFGVQAKEKEREKLSTELRAALLQIPTPQNLKFASRSAREGGGKKQVPLCFQIQIPSVAFACFTILSLVSSPLTPLFRKIKVVYLSCACVANLGHFLAFFSKHVCASVLRTLVF